MGQTIENLIMGYIAVMSLIGFGVMGIDKYRAIHKQWRIPEKTLLLIACLGGGIGAFLGMYFFHHKSRHAKFVIILPLTAVIDLFVILRTYGII